MGRSWQSPHLRRAQLLGWTAAMSFRSWKRVRQVGAGLVLLALATACAVSHGSQSWFVEHPQGLSKLGSEAAEALQCPQARMAFTAEGPSSPTSPQAQYVVVRIDGCGRSQTYAYVGSTDLRREQDGKWMPAEELIIVPKAIRRGELTLTDIVEGHPELTPSSYIRVAKNDGSKSHVLSARDVLVDHRGLYRKRDGSGKTYVEGWHWVHVAKLEVISAARFACRSEPQEPEYGPISFTAAGEKTHGSFGVSRHVTAALGGALELLLRLTFSSLDTPRPRRCHFTSTETWTPELVVRRSSQVRLFR